MRSETSLGGLCSVWDFLIFSLPSVARNSEEGLKGPGGKPPGLQEAKRVSEGLREGPSGKPSRPRLWPQPWGALESPDCINAESSFPHLPGSSHFLVPAAGPQGREVALLFPGVFGTASYLLRSPLLKGIQGSLGDLTPTQAPGGPQDGLDLVADSGCSLHFWTSSAARALPPPCSALRQ